MLRLLRCRAIQRLQAEGKRGIEGLSRPNTLGVDLEKGEWCSLGSWGACVSDVE